jgi:hypothetical protein
MVNIWEARATTAGATAPSGALPDPARPFAQRPAVTPVVEPARTAPSGGDDEQVEALRATASELTAVLPTRVEAAVARALAAGDAGGLDRRLAGVARAQEQTGQAVEAIAADVLAERLARAEDLELLVELVGAGGRAVRADIARLQADLADLRASLAALAATVADLRPALAALSRQLDRPLQVTVERAAPHAAHGACGSAAPLEDVPLA